MEARAINSLDYSAYTTAISVDLGNLTATGTGGAIHFDDLTGGKASDTLGAFKQVRREVITVIVSTRKRQRDSLFPQR